MSKEVALHIGVSIIRERRDTKSSLKTWFRIFGSDCQQCFDLSRNSGVSISKSQGDGDPFWNFMVESLIVLKNLSKKFGKKNATNRISMSIRPVRSSGFWEPTAQGKQRRSACFAD